MFSDQDLFFECSRGETYKHQKSTNVIEKDAVARKKSRYKLHISFEIRTPNIQNGFVQYVWPMDT